MPAVGGGLPLSSLSLLLLPLLPLLLVAAAVMSTKGAAEGLHVQHGSAAVHLPQLHSCAHPLAVLELQDGLRPCCSRMIHVMACTHLEPVSPDRRLLGPEVSLGSSPPAAWAAGSAEPSGTGRPRLARALRSCCRALSCWRWGCWPLRLPPSAAWKKAPILDAALCLPRHATLTPQPPHAWPDVLWCASWHRGNFVTKCHEQCE